MYICIPTYNEFEKVISVLSSLKDSTFNNFKVVLVNANYGDKTTKYLRKYSINYLFEIIEIKGNSEEYWSRTVNRGLEYIIKNKGLHDSILLCNVDIVFRENTIVRLYYILKKMNFDCIIGAISLNNDKVISSGVKILSWFFPIKNYHPLTNSIYSNICNSGLVEVDFLPSRCILIPLISLDINNLVLYSKLPHYHADYEFTNRLKRSGYQLYLAPSASVYVDINNTGLNVFNSSFDIKLFIKNYFSIKNQSNPFYRFNFIIATFPKWAVPTALFTYFIKSLLELLYALIKTILQK